jgi:long-chain acyl-CoA synthetase
MMSEYQMVGTVKAPGARGAIFRKAYEDKLANLKAGNGTTHWFWDRVLFKKVAAVLGGNVRLMMYVL